MPVRSVIAVVLFAGSFALAGETGWKDAAPLFQKYCYECHADGMSKGDFALDELLKDPAGSRQPQWEKTWKMVRDEFMPPAGADAPAADERRALTRWIEEAKLGVSYEKPDPGRVTMRRLNRMEYEFTVTDLFGTDFTEEGEFSSDVSTSKARLRDMLPPDDTAFGFDNIGDFQTLSPALLEKYFDLAEFVVDRVVSQHGPRFPETILNAAALKIEQAAEKKRTEHVIEFETAHDGKYRIGMQFGLGGWQEYGGAYEFGISVDDQALTKDTIEVGGQKLFKYAPEAALSKGRHRLTFFTDAVKKDAAGKLTHLELRPKMKITGPLDAGVVEYPEPHRRLFFAGDPPADPAKRRDYARQILQRVADRAFRRPVPAGTLDRLTELAMREESFERGIAHAIMAVLTSPKFLFRAEQQPQPDDPAAVHPLDEYALASRLSSFLWLSLPDEELTGLASRGELRRNLPAQIRRMLADTKAARFFEDFPGQWLRTRNVLMTPVSRVDKELNPLRGAMKRETEMLFEHIARNDRDLLELVTADYTFADRPLADYYGLTGLTGDEFQKVSLPAGSKRGGILTHASFLVSTSNPNRTSPVKRGLFVLENLLAIHPPPPPANVPALDDAKPDGATLRTVREQLAAHREDKSCAACHAHFDPIGVVLENYDLIGRWRTVENGEPIEPAEKTISGQTLTGIDDLKQYFIARKARFYQCVTEKLLTYALGRGLDPGDMPAVNSIAEKVMADGGKFSTLLTAVVESVPFQMRRGDTGTLKTAPRLAIPEPPPPELRKGPKRRERPARPQ